jgi:hypothetical protein
MTILPAPITLPNLAIFAQAGCVAFNPLLLPKERGDSFQSNSNPKKYAAQTKTTHPL